MTKEQQDKAISTILEATPIDVAEVFITKYKDEFLQEFDDKLCRDVMEKAFEAIKNELVTMGMQYIAAGGLTNKGIVMNYQLGDRREQPIFKEPATEDKA